MALCFVCLLVTVMNTSIGQVDGMHVLALLLLCVTLGVHTSPSLSALQPVYLLFDVQSCGPV